MKSAAKVAPVGMALGAVVILAAWVSFSPVPAVAQGTQGQNAVYNSSGNCSPSSPCLGSSAFIDASVFGNPNTTTFCSVIYGILRPVSYSTSVIDARGLNSTNTKMTCASGTSPWNNGSNYVNKPSVILLPAGTIYTSASWVLPANTKLIGTAKGSGSIGTTNYAFETAIQASASFSGAVVQFGNSTFCPSGCQGISVEHLTISGAGYTMNGIENDNCGLQCYVEHVTLYEVLGTGLKVGGSYATDSGPYC